MKTHIVKLQQQLALERSRERALSENLEEMDEDEEEAMHDRIQSDFEIGAAFRERIVPHAVLWFTGEAADDDLEFEEEDDEEDDGDEEDDNARR